MKTLNNTSLMDLADTRNIASSAGSANESGCLTVNILINQNNFYLDTPLIDILNYATENKGVVIAHYDPSRGHYGDKVFYLVDFANSPYTRYAVFKCDNVNGSDLASHTTGFQDDYFVVNQPYNPNGFLPEVCKMYSDKTKPVIFQEYEDDSGAMYIIKDNDYENFLTANEVYNWIIHNGYNTIGISTTGSSNGYFLNLVKCEVNQNKYTILFSGIIPQKNPTDNGYTLSFIGASFGFLEVNSSTKELNLYSENSL